MFEWFDKYNPILHYDPVNTLVLTRADLMSFQHLLILSNFVQTGQEYILTEAEAQQNVKQLLNEYKNGNLETKVDLASMQYIYLQVLMAYQQFNASQKQQLSSRTKQNVTQNSREKDAIMSQIIQMGNISRHNMIETMGSGDKTFYSLDYSSPLSW